MLRKRIRRTIMILLLIAAGVVVAVRWNAWFGNPPEPPYTVDNTPHNLMLTLGQDGEHERVVSWRCDTVLRPSFLSITCPDSTTLTIEATGEVIPSRSGKAAFYRAHLGNLAAGTYTVVAHSDSACSAPHTMIVRAEQAVHEFVALGDIQATTRDYSSELFSSVLNGCPEAEFMLQAGDLIERPSDNYWQLFFSTFLSDTLLPVVAATGNHEYLKGIIKTIDSRWTSVFVNPKNGPLVGLGKSYYVDYFGMRIVVLDTDGLLRVPDFTRSEAWLHRVLSDTAATGLWKTVVMHHPTRSAGLGRDNPLIFAAFAKTLKKADIIISGHDHSYARRIINHRHGDKQQTLSYVVSSSDKCYLPKLSDRDDRLLSAHPQYLRIRYDSTMVEVATYLVSDNTLYDKVVLSRDTTAIDYFIGVGEILDMPERYAGKDNVKTRTFRKRRAERLSR